MFNDSIMVRYKNAPITGEPPGWNASDFSDLERQVKLYHATSFGNGNYGGGSPPSATGASRVKAASKAAGARITAINGVVTPGLNSISVTMNWMNTGICPTYDNWDIVFDLVNSAGAVTTLGKSAFQLRLFLPGTAPMTQTDVFPLNVPAGSYTLRVTVKDPTGYRVPLQLSLQGRNGNGSYNLKTFQR